MQCDYYDARRCLSCTWMGQPYADQLAAKQAAAEQLLGPGIRWGEPVAGPEQHFRTKAKMVVGGTAEAPTLGILDAEGHGVDLRECGLHTPGVTAALPVLAQLVTRAHLVPYDVPSRSGELKYVLVTEAADGRLMVRLVTRSTESLARLRKHLPWLLDQLPTALVVTLNIQPEHKAVLEGEREIVLTDAAVLPLPMGGVPLALAPGSFVQTNGAVAARLYRMAADWVADLSPSTVWDLYCGAGGFALHLAAPGRTVTGVEVSQAAVAVTQARAPAGVTFVVGDATQWVADRKTAPDLVVVNPPRRGIGDELCGHLERLRPPTVLYSSCNPPTLARDLTSLPSYRVARAQVFDMFPQTGHHEVLALLHRQGGSLN